MKKELHILLVEDLSSDVELAKRELNKIFENYKVKLVETEEDFLDALDVFKPDLIISDYQMPIFNGLRALKLRNEKCPFTPFIVLTGLQNEDTAVECFHAGADDYVIKEHIKRLGTAVENAIDKKKIEKEQKKAEIEITKLSRAVEQSPSLIAITNLKGELEYVNPKFTELTGYPREELIGKSTSILKSGELPNDIYKELWELISEGKVWHGEFHNKKKNEELYWELATVSPIFDGSGEIINYLKVAEDITERKKIENELRESEDRFKRLFDELGDAVYVTIVGGKNTGKILEVNEAAVNQTGFSRTELLQMNINDLSVIGSSKINTYDLDEKLSKGKSVKTTEQKKKKDGTLFWTEVSVTAIEYKGEKAGLSINHDITDSKKAEEEILEILKREQIQADIVRNAPLAIVFGYLDGHLDNYNKAFMELTGYNDEELKNISWNKLTPSKWSKSEVENLRKLSPKNNYIKYEKEYIHKNGTIIPMELLVTAKFDSNNNLIHYIAFISDISERKLANEKLLIERDKLKSVLDSMTDGIYIADKNYNISYVNPRLQADFGNPTGKKCYKYLHNLDNPCSFCNNEKVFAGETVLWEHVFFDKGKTFEIIDSPFINSDATISKFQILRDITERKRADVDLKKRMNELEIFNDAAVDREIMINDLRKEINDLLKSMGKDDKYKIVS